MKLRKQHISEVWNEGEDGYWIALNHGFKWDGDPVGSVHCIHEETKAKAHKEGVLACNCKDCKKEFDKSI